MKAEEILPKLRNAKSTQNGWTALCPAHHDQKRSLSITEKDGRVLLNCFAGCAYGEIIAALGIDNQNNGGASKNKIAKIYDYTDEYGNLIYQNVRFSPKGFGQRHFKKDGTTVWGLNRVRRVPYRLPQLVALNSTQGVVMTEGEKDADKLVEHGFPATNHKNWQKEFNYLLKDKRVLIFQDHDRAGVEQAMKVAKMVYRDASVVKVVDCYADEPLPEKHGKDVSDYLEEFGMEKLQQLIDETPYFVPTNLTDSDKPQRELKVVYMADVETKEIEWLWNPFIPLGEFTLMDGMEGIGKSWIACALACAVADGVRLPFSETAPLPPSKVLMLSAEDSLSHTVKPRLLSMNANLGRILAINSVFSLSHANDVILFESVIAEHQPKLVIVDPLFSYTGGKNLNQESDSRPIAQKLISIAQKFNCAIIGIRHIGKAKGNGEARAAGLGSISWRASARSGLLVGRDEETGETALCQTKTNLARKADFAVGYEIRDNCFYWKSEPSKLTAEKMLSQPKDSQAKAEQSEAVEFLREVLRDGERPSKEIEKEAKELAITTYAYRQARTVLGVESFKKGGHFGGENSWYLRLPNAERIESNAKDADISKIRHLQATQISKTSYSNGLAEDVESGKNKHLQKDQGSSSTGTVPKVRMGGRCSCGSDGFVGELCPNCGEILIPF